MHKLASVLSWPAEGGACLMCRSGAIEDVAHFVQGCPALSRLRKQFADIVATRLPLAGIPGSCLLSEFHKGGPAQLRLVLGSNFSFPVCPPDSIDRYSEQCAMALWSLDSTSKNFFSVAWRYRSSIVGELKVVRGIVRVPPVRSTSHHQSCGAPPFSPPDHLKRFWSRCCPTLSFLRRLFPPAPVNSVAAAEISSWYSVAASAASFTNGTIAKLA